MNDNLVLIKPPMVYDVSPESSSSSLTSNSTTTSLSSGVSSPISRVRLETRAASLTTKSLSSSPSSSQTTTSTSSSQHPAIDPSVKNMSAILGLPADSKMDDALKSGKRINVAINFYLRDHYSSLTSLSKSKSSQSKLSISSISSIIKAIDDLSIDTQCDDNNETKCNEFPINIIEYIGKFLQCFDLMIWSSINQLHRTLVLESEDIWSAFLLKANYCCEYIDNSSLYLQMIRGKLLNLVDINQATKDNNGILSVIKLEDHLDKTFVRNIYDNIDSHYLYNLYKLCDLLYRKNICPSCWAPNSIVHYLYGFPSDKLMEYHKKLYIFNGDYIFDKSPIFCCSLCKEEFDASPHHVCTLDVLNEELLFVCF